MDAGRVDNLKLNVFPLRVGAAPQKAPEPTARGAGSFAEMLKAALAEVNDLQHKAEQAATQLVAGDASSLHQIMIATEEANIALQFTMAIRNKILDAYTEIMRMQV
ncbi:MAG: flagellar hook-basal body complex protein FliE [Syntrophothermus sp.]